MASVGTQTFSPQQELRSLGSKSCAPPFAPRATSLQGPSCSLPTWAIQKFTAGQKVLLRLDSPGLSFVWPKIQRKAQMMALRVYLGQVEHLENNADTRFFSVTMYCYSNTFFPSTQRSLLPCNPDDNPEK